MGRFDVNALVRKVDLLTLKLFLTVVEEGQLARAASREHIVPSAVTKRIQELEELIGIKLFHRAPKGAVLTPGGRVVARHIRTIFGGIDQMRDEIGEFADGPRGYVRVAANESIIIEFLANEIHRFATEYPDIEIELLPQPNPDMSRHFALGTADIGIFASYGAARRIAVQDADVSEYRTDQLVAVVPRGHDLATKPEISLRDLVDAGLIGLRPASPFMDNLRKAADSEGFSLRLKYEVTTNESARALVRAGLGVSIQPRGVLGLEDYARISLVPLTQIWATRRLSVAVQAGQPPSAAASTFLAQLSHCQAGKSHMGDAWNPVELGAGEASDIRSVSRIR